MNRTEKPKPSKGICKRFADWLKNLAFLQILEYLGRLSILFAVIFFFWEHGDRQKAKHYQAWQVINLAQGKPGSGGRIDALQDLNKDRVSLAGVDVSKANLRFINLEKADLTDANFYEADLWNANFAGAFMGRANLSGASMIKANLSKAQLLFAKLPGADLRMADLSGALMIHANLSGADLEGANLSGALLEDANIPRAKLLDANLSGADLKTADLKDIVAWGDILSIKLANIYGIKNPPDGFVEWAKEHGAVSIKSTDEWKKLIEEKGKKQKAN